MNIKNDYISEILKRTKPCQQCGKPFIDLTKNQNRKFCSKTCRNHHDENRQQRKIWRHKYYLRKIRPTRRLTQKGHNYFIGTITEKDLDRRIENLLSICKQQQ